MEGPRVWDNDEDVIFCKLRRVGHDTMIEETSHLARASKQGIGPKLAVLPVDHLLAERGPGVRVDREDNKHLKRVEAPKRGTYWDSQG